ncbi:MAG: hypothetical protein E7224_04945, partial [Clostridiales bacterium]|nr:hypothetical protein [Clostridiales bacterium]
MIVKKSLLRIFLIAAVLVCLMSVVAMADTCTDPCTEPNHVAAIGLEHYTSVKDAVAEAQDGDTVVILADHSVECDSTWLTIERKITIDLNGKKISATANSNFTKLISVVGDSNDSTVDLTLQDSSSSKTGRIDVTAPSSLDNLLRVETSANVVIQSGTYTLDKSTNGCGMIDSRGDEILTINDGTFLLGNIGSASNGSPWILNTSGQNTKNIIVNGGTFNDDIFHMFYPFEVMAPKERALRNNSDGTWTMVDAVAWVNEQERSGAWYTNEVGYATLEEAIAAANGNSGVDSSGVVNTITLLDNCTMNGAAAITRDVVITGDYTITAADGVDPMITVEAGTTLTLAGGNYAGNLSTTGDGKIVIDPAADVILGFSQDPSGWISAEDKLYTVTFRTNGGSDVLTRVLNENSAVKEPVSVRPGHTFVDWFEDEGLISEYDFQTLLTSNVTLYAKWDVNWYTITYTDGVNGEEIFADKSETLTYGSATPTFGADPVRVGFKFLGWEPALEATVSDDQTYKALWEEKETIGISPASQSHTWDGDKKAYVVAGTDLPGFVVEYMVGGNWVSAAPSDAGRYAVRITRAEDENYKAYEKTLAEGLVIHEAFLDYDAPTLRGGMPYNGSLQTLADSGMSEHGTVYYAVSLTDDSSGDNWSTTIPAAKNAGTYYIWYKVIGDVNYGDVDAACIGSVTITKADPDVTAWPVFQAPIYVNDAAAVLGEGAVKGADG